MTQKEFEQRFQAFHTQLVEELIKLNAYLKMLKLIETRKQDRIEQLNLAPAFFRVTETALFSSLIIWTSKLFDPREQSSIPRFLNFLRPNIKYLSIENLKARRKYQDVHWMLDRPEITDELINKHLSDVSQIKAVSKIKLHRDKYHAHFDSKYFLDTALLKQEAPITWDEIEGIPSLGLEIIDFYSIYFDGSTNHIDYVGINDLNVLLDCLKRYDEIRAAQSKQLIL